MVEPPPLGESLIQNTDILSNAKMAIKRFNELRDKKQKAYLKVTEDGLLKCVEKISIGDRIATTWGGGPKLKNIIDYCNKKGIASVQEIQEGLQKAKTNYLQARVEKFNAISSEESPTQKAAKSTDFVANLVRQLKRFKADEIAQPEQQQAIKDLVKTAGKCKQYLGALFLFSRLTPQNQLENLQLYFDIISHLKQEDVSHDKVQHAIKQMIKQAIEKEKFSEALKLFDKLTPANRLNVAVKLEKPETIKALETLDDKGLALDLFFKLSRDTQLANGQVLLNILKTVAPAEREKHDQSLYNLYDNAIRYAVQGEWDEDIRGKWVDELRPYVPNLDQLRAQVVTSEAVASTPQSESPPSPQGLKIEDFPESSYTPPGSPKTPSGSPPTPPPPTHEVEDETLVEVEAQEVNSEELNYIASGIETALEASQTPVERLREHWLLVANANAEKLLKGIKTTELLPKGREILERIQEKIKLIKEPAEPIRNLAEKIQNILDQTKPPQKKE